MTSPLFQLKTDRTIHKALDRTRRLFAGGTIASDSNEIHRAKSLLYVAIERVRMKQQALDFLYQGLCDLLQLVTLRGDPREKDWQIAVKKLEELEGVEDEA